MNKITVAGLVICIGGFICAFACIACSTAWPTVISILIGTIIGIPLICYGATQGTTLIKQSDGAKITVTENNERILKNKGFYIWLRENGWREINVQGTNRRYYGDK